MNAVAINDYYDEDYVNMTCSRCVGGQAAWVLDDEMLVCNLCRAELESTS